MFGVKDISIDLLTDNPAMIFLTLAALVALAVFLYRRTNPPLPAHLRMILFACRTIAVLALAAALLEPVISYSREFERRRRVSVLVDASSSMDTRDEHSNRRARVDSLLSSDSFERLKSSVDTRSYYFGDNLVETRRNVSPDKTALGEAVYELEQAEMVEPPDYRLLLSDGNSNSGRSATDVVDASSVPIVAVNVAADAGSFDVALADVRFNTVVFVGQPTEIEVKLSWHNAEGISPRVQLVEEDEVIAESGLTIDQETGFGEVRLRYVPATPGQHLLQVRVPALDNETILTNNRRTIAVKALKSRISVLLVSERPDHELGFLKRYLAQSDKYEAELRVIGDRAGNLTGRFPDRRTEINRYDLVVLHDVDPHLLSGREDIINSYIADKGGAVWVFMGERLAASGPVPWFDKLLPFHQSRGRPVEYREFRGQPAEGELFHPAVRLADSRIGVRETWASLPPFRSLVVCDVIAPDAVVLAYAEVSGFAGMRPPILGYRRHGAGKLIAVAAGPMWHWSFVSLGFGDESGSYGRFLEGVISWLTVREDFDPVNIAPVKEVFNRAEEVRFDAVAFDQGFRPIPGVIGMVEVQGKTETDKFHADLTGAGNGRYFAEFTQLPPGEYSWTGRLETEGRLLKENSGMFQVETFSLEEFDASPDPSALMAISKLSGGDYFTYAAFDDALAAIGTEPVRESVSSEFSVWGRFWLLVVFILALAAEWVLRKINNLL
jgi:hypothetical protein